MGKDLSGLKKKALRPQFIFQILKTIQGQDQDRFGQDQDLKKWSFKTGLKDYITAWVT